MQQDTQLMPPRESDFLWGTIRFIFWRYRQKKNKKKSYTVSGVPKTLPRWKIHPWLRFIYSDILRLHSWILFPSIIEKGVTCVQGSCSREPTGNPASKVLLEGMRGMVIMHPLTAWWEKISLHGGKKSQTPRWTAGVQHKPHCSHKPMRHTKLRLLDGEGWVQPQIQAGLQEDSELRPAALILFCTDTNPFSRSNHTPHMKVAISNSLLYLVEGLLETMAL